MSVRIGCALAAALSLAGCGGGGGGESGCRTSLPSSSGPGDVSNHVPLTPGSRWIYDVIETSSGAVPQRYRTRVEVTGTRTVSGVVASVVEQGKVGDPASPDVSLLAKGPSGVTEYAGGGVEPPLDRLYPYQVVQFPLTAGASFEQVSCSGLDYGADLDGDGKNERVDVRSVVTVAGVEGVSVAAGSFDAVRVDTHLVLTIHFTTGQSATATGDQSIWFAPGVGPVRTRSTLSIEGRTDTLDEALVGYEVEGRRGGLQGSATLASGVAPANSDTESPGQPALSFDGSGHLLVFRASTASSFGQDQVSAVVLGADGAGTAQVVVSDRAGYGHRPAAAFNGQDHLVVSNHCRDDCGTVLAQRVTPAGVLLDGPGGFDLVSGATTVYPPGVASDGVGWLVAWTTYPAGLQAALVTAAGQAQAPFTLSATASGGPRPAVAFGGGSYLVAWVEGERVLAARVTPAGVVLDVPPIGVSTAPGPKWLGGAAFDGARFLVAWGDGRRGDTVLGTPALDVYAARLSATGALLDGPPESGGIVVNALAGSSKLDPQVAFDGKQFVLAWWIEGFYGQVGVFAARVASDGALVDGPAGGTGLWVAAPEAYASRLVHPVVAPAGGGESLVAWVDNTELMGQTKSIRGAWYAW